MANGDKITSATNQFATDVLGESTRSNFAPHDTMIESDTIELTKLTLDNNSELALAPHSSGKTTKHLGKRPSSNSGHFAASSLSVQVSPADELESQSAAEAVLDTTYRGLPSWLTSLIFHLVLILGLAIFSVGDRGKSLVELVASDSEFVELEPLETLDFRLEAEEIETISDDSSFSQAVLLDSRETTEIVDNSMLDASLENDTDNLFEKISNEGLSEGQLNNKNSEGGANFFGINGGGTDFVYIIDCSGSMSEYGRWKLAVRELKRSVKQMTVDQKFLILLYNNGFVAMNNRAELVQSTQREQRKALRWLGRNFPNNWTFCSQAIAKALSLKPDAIFLLSDGEFDDRENVFATLKQMNSKRRLISTEGKQIPVHTIALGSHVGRWTMKQIADENSGVFRLIE